MSESHLTYICIFVTPLISFLSTKGLPGDTGILGPIGPPGLKVNCSQFKYKML